MTQFAAFSHQPKTKFCRDFSLSQQWKLSWMPSTAVLIEKREIWGAFCLNENFFLWFPMFEPFSLLPRSPSGLPRTAEPVLLAYIAEIYNFAARQSHILLAPSGALIAIPTYYWSTTTTHPLFQITPVLNTGLSLSEPLQLYKGYNAI